MQENVNAQAIRGNWPMLAVRGVLALIFGLVALIYPGIALIAFIYIFAGYVLIDGVAAVTTAIRERGFLRRWGWRLFAGLLGAVVGIVAFIFPGLIAVVLLYVVAAWAIMTGIAQIVAAFATRGFAIQEWALGLAGLISILFGIFLFINPGAGLLALLWL